MRTTTRVNWRFTFTIGDLGRMLGKSPVTIRGWDSRGLVTIPRDKSGDRKLGCKDLREVTNTARSHQRITDSRANLVYAVITILEEIEQANNRKVKK